MLSISSLYQSITNKKQTFLKIFAIAILCCGINNTVGAKEINLDTALKIHTELLETVKASGLEDFADQKLLQRLTNPQTNKLDRALIYDKADWSDIADLAWFTNRYKVKKSKIQAKGIKILDSFNQLSKEILDANLDGVTKISQKASVAQKRHALFDAEGEEYIYFIAKALGPELGKALIKVYDEGKIKKTTALIQQSVVSTGAAKKYFKFPRPYNIENNKVVLIKDTYVFKDQVLYYSDGLAFPSGHTNTGNTVSLFFALMLPEKYPALIIRGATYGFSRGILGVHYPLDMIGGRIHSQYTVATLLADAKYQKLFAEAKAELRAALEKETGQSLAKFITKEDNSSYQNMADFFQYTINYGLPKVVKNQNQPLHVPANAINLLKYALPQLSKKQLKQLLIDTAEPYGDALSVSKYGDWQRINLFNAYNKAINK